MRRSEDSAPLVASSFAFVPACLVLAPRSMLLALPYAAATATAMAYHRSEERAFVRLDHGCAYSVIAVNVWMLLHASRITYALAGSSLIMLGLACYFRAHERAYEKWHTLWHLLSGMGGLFLALAYR